MTCEAVIGNIKTKFFMKLADHVEVCAMMVHSEFSEKGWPESAIYHENRMVRLTAYQKLGWTKEALLDECPLVKLSAKKHFLKCADILGIPSVKYDFTKDEITLLIFNDIKINKKLIN